MIDLKVFHDMYVISNSKNNKELKFLKSEYDREAIDEIYDFMILVDELAEERGQSMIFHEEGLEDV